LFCSQEDEVSGIVLFASSGVLPGWCVQQWHLQQLLQLSARFL